LPRVHISKKQNALTFRRQDILPSDDETAMLKPDFAYFNPNPSARKQRIFKKSVDELRYSWHNLPIRGFFGRME
jgi:hypothetical protein